jgi:hypothetical protein
MPIEAYLIGKGSEEVSGCSPRHARNDTWKSANNFCALSHCGEFGFGLWATETDLLRHYGSLLGIGAMGHSAKFLETRQL